MESKTTNGKGRKYKQTKQLVRMALNDGWTQQDIARACRTHQSVVSSWSKGQKVATEEQLRPLLEQYGHKLHRNAFRLYWNRTNETNQFFKVEGKVILSHTLSDSRRVAHKLVKKIPKYKLVIHAQGQNQFRIIYQYRITFTQSGDEFELSQDDANWHSMISDPLNAEQLIDKVEQFAQDKFAEYPVDGHALPFMIRQALMNHGFMVDEVVEYPAVW